MKTIIRVSLVVAGIFILGIVVGVNYAIENVLPYSPIRPQRCTAAEMARFTPDLLSPAAFTSRWNEFDITVEDSIRLKGWFIHSTVQPARGTILILHGIASCRIAMLSDAKISVQNGYNCILYDARANGESGGLNCTFGYYEKHDVSAYLDSALVRYPGCGPFGIMGDSFGAAVAIQALAIDKRLVCGVAESPFSTLREVIHDYFRQMFHLPVDFIPDAALKHSERIAHFVVDSVRPVDDARRILQPTMIIHGEADSKISPEYGKRVFDNLASPNKELYLIPMAGHDDLAAVGGSEYQRRILAFFNRHLISPGPPA
jgi:pimeloyl-ACP methyl ester carboxylesterase